MNAKKADINFALQFTTFTIGEKFSKCTEIIFYVYPDNYVVLESGIPISLEIPMRMG